MKVTGLISKVVSVAHCELNTLLTIKFCFLLSNYSTFINIKILLNNFF